MNILKRMEQSQFEQLVFCQDQASGLKAIIAIHNTKLGPALGGCRMWAYTTEEDAILDALRLAQGMTYKAAISGLPYGGGKAVIIGNPNLDKHKDLFRSLGRFIQTMQGRYITGMDLGTTVNDMDWTKLETDYVTDSTGSMGATDNFTAEMTAYGVFLGIKASVKQAFGSDLLKDKKVAVQGLGKVGYLLCRYLHESGVQLVVSDINEDRVHKVVNEFGARSISPDHIYGEPCDVFAPCALGGILNDYTLPQLKCKIVAGAANNQLAEAGHGERLKEQGILYAPDYVINAGGLIITAVELEGYDSIHAKQCVEHIYTTITNVFQLAELQGISPSASADRIVQQVLMKG
jgi:leucine dehydrogenase